MKLKANQIDGALGALSADVRAVLIYGPDEGLVRERAERVAKQAVDDINDPFNVILLTGERLKIGPSVLTDEMSSISMVGGRRLIKLENIDNSIADKVEAALDQPSVDTLLLVLGGDLKTGGLRALFEGARKDLIAAPCYRDEGFQLENLIREQMAEAGLSANADAMGYLSHHLGNDRGVTRQEVAKLALYKHGTNEPLSLKEVQSLIGDNAVDAIGLVAEASTSGSVQAVDALLDRAWREGTSPIAILRQLADRLYKMIAAKSLLEKGEGVDQALKKLRIFWKDQKPFAAALSKWHLGDLQTAYARVLAAEMDCKTTGMPAEAICSRLCLQIAVSRRHRR